MAKNKKPQKSLLNENTIRRMMKLAEIPSLTDSFLTEKWGSKKGEYKREDEEGVEKKAGDVDHHYKDYEGKPGGNKGDDSKTHPGRKDYIKEDEHEEEELHATEDELGDEDEVADEEGAELDAEASRRRRSRNYS